MRRIKVVLLGIIMMMLLCPVNIQAEGDKTYISGDFIFCHGMMVEGKRTLILTEYKGNDAIVTIPSFVEGKEKTKIVRCHTARDKVELPDSVKIIGDYAFAGCNKIVEAPFLKRILICLPLGQKHSMVVLVCRK